MIVLNYEAIGARIKDARTMQNLSQERMAELTGLSTTHTSHVETGKTKVSLPSLIKIANVLGVSLDELVCDSIIKGRNVFEGELAFTLSDCNELEIRVISDMVKALKKSLRERINVRYE